MIRHVDLQQMTKMSGATVTFEEASAASNKTLSIHRWANWIAGFSGDFALGALKQYLPSPKRGALILDPFAGVGTTLVEAYRRDIDCVGFEINPFAALVSRVKLQAVDFDVLNLQMVIDHYRGHMRALELNKCATRPMPHSIPPLVSAAVFRFSAKPSKRKYFTLWTTFRNYHSRYETSSGWR